MTLKMLSLFSGIGGMDLAAQWAGIETVAFCEIDKFCQKVLAKHWPGVPIFDDVRQLTTESLRERGVESVDIIALGFPCQDVSRNGKRVGIGGERSGLWAEGFRIIREVRPRYVVVENVTGLLDGGIGRVLADLSEGGFDAEWETLPASAFGFYHERERVFIVAHRPRGDGQPHGLLEASRERRTSLQLRRLHSVAVATRGKRENTRLEREPDMARLVHGFPGIVDEIRAYGNCVVPAQIQPIFEAIITYHLESQ